MNKEVFLSHRLSLRLDLGLIGNSQLQKLLSSIDSQKTEWEIAGRFSRDFLENLELNTIVSSAGASTRIEGSKLTDKQVEMFLRQTKMRKLETRDEQEVAGYLEIIQLIFQEYNSIEINELTIKQIHSILLKFIQSGPESRLEQVQAAPWVKDTKHRGSYKTQSNQVVAVNGDGSIAGIIFDPTSPEDTPKEMQELLEWTQSAFRYKIFHPILIISNFVFEFLSTHPFKDGNGRVSRAVTNLLLLKNGYSFARYIAHEKLIEETKVEYYLSLRKTTNTWKTDKEDMSHWFFYILEIFEKQVSQAVKLIGQEKIRNLLNENQYKVYTLFLSNESLARKEIAEKTEIPIKSVEGIIKKLLELNQIERLGRGSTTRYRLKNN